MPITVDQACELLVELGVEDETIAILKGDDAAKIAEVKPTLSKTIIETQKAILAEDPDFRKPIESEVRGAILNTKAQETLRLYKDFVTREEYDKLPEKERYSELLKLIAKKVNAKLAEGSTDTELAKKIEELNAEIVKRDETITAKEAEIEEARSGADHKLNEYRLNQTVENTFNSTLGDKLIAKKELLFPAIKSELLSKYDVKIEGDAVVLYEKGKAVKAMKNSKPLALAQAFEDIATAQDAIKKQPAVPPKGPITEKNDPPQKVELKGSNKLKEEIEKREAAQS